MHPGMRSAVRISHRVARVADSTFARQARGLELSSEENSGQAGIERFVGEHYIQNGFSKTPEDPGRAWSKEELELKGYEDLRQIWFTVLIERNHLKSIELYFAHQEETLGKFPHPTRLDRVELTLMRIREVMEERHKVSTKVAWAEFMRRCKERYYRYPAGPQPPDGYNDPRRQLHLYTRARLVPHVDESGVHLTPTQIVDALCEKIGFVLDVKVLDVEEALTAEGEERRERSEFLSGQLQKVSRNMIPNQTDLVESWNAERDELQTAGPVRYTITVGSKDIADAIVERARGGEDEVMQMEAVEGEAPAAAAFKDEEHLFVDAEVSGPMPAKDELELYAHVLAREEHEMMRLTRPAIAQPMEFSKAPIGIDPFQRRRFDHEHNHRTTRFEATGERKTLYWDTPHKGTTIVSSFNKPGADH